MDPRAAQAQVPALLLQPLVENAVKHGVGAHDGSGVVRIEATIERDRLVVRVIDRSSGTRIGVLEDGAGIALETLRERLAMRFRGEAKLTLDPHESGMCARVERPWDEVNPEAERTAA